MSEAKVEPVGARKILDAYADFQEWYWNTKLDQGASEDEIREYPTSELLSEMFRWRELGKPT